MRQTYVEWIFELAAKLKISHNSSHLAVCLLDSLYFSTTSCNGKLQLYAPTCLLLAGIVAYLSQENNSWLAKTIELDERIPFIPKLRRLANPSFSVDDYRRAELTLLDNIDWNPQYTSLLEFSEFYLSQGVVFSSDDYYNEDDDMETHKENKYKAKHQSSKPSRRLDLITALKENSENIPAVWNPGQIIANNKSKRSSQPLTKKISSMEDSKVLEVVQKIESSASKLCNHAVRSKLLGSFSLYLYPFVNQNWNWSRQITSFYRVLASPTCVRSMECFQDGIY